jgi:hypothetical protein
MNHRIWMFTCRWVYNCNQYGVTNSRKYTFSPFTCLGFQCTEGAAEGVWVAYAYRRSWSLFLFSPVLIYSRDIFSFFFPSLFDTSSFSPFVFKRTYIPSERLLKQLRWSVRPSARLYICNTVIVTSKG